MKKIALALTIISILIAAPLAYAHDQEKEKDRNNVRIQAHFENGDDDEDEKEDEEEGENHDQNKFEIKGEIESIGDNSFVVLGQTIVIDPTKVREFEQKGILEVDKKIKVEGIIIDGTYYATEINVIGTGQGRFKIEIKGLILPSPSGSASPTPTVSPTPSGSPEASPTGSPTASPTSSPTALVNVEVKARGTLEQITLFFQGLLEYLQGLL